MADRTWPNLLTALLHGEELSTADTAWAMGEIMAGSATPVQTAGFVIALRAKGESPAEIAGFAEAMLASATRVQLPEAVRDTAVDIVGTGGDRAHTVNISTMAAIAVAAAGVRVVKHGNRAASSACGAADLLEEFGIPLDLGPDEVARCLTEVGIGFCFAARYHPGMRHAAVPRREMGVPTAFNFLGPLTNPAQPTAALVGCFDQRMAGVMANVFAERGHSVLVVRGEDGLDELTTTGPTRIWAVRDGRVTESTLDAGDLGIARSQPGDLRGGDAPFNAEAARSLFAGKAGPVRDAVLINAAGALVAREGWGDDLPGALRAAVDRVATTIDSGAAADLLARWVTTAKSLRPAG
jgi:anthranilate phosphoribosyltransferase